jgi:hypothetical protein
MARTTVIKGIKFEDYTDPDEKIHSNAREKAIEAVDRNIESLRKGGFKRVEFDTIAGYHYRDKQSGRFVPITTMHLLRVLKR